MEKNELKPAGVFHYFDEICQVPRPSKKEEKIIAHQKARYTGYGEPENRCTAISHRHGVRKEQRYAA